MSRFKFQGLSRFYLNSSSYIIIYLTSRLQTTKYGAFNDPVNGDLDHRSKSNVKILPKNEQWSMHLSYHSLTSYLVPRYNTIDMICKIIDVISCYEKKHSNNKKHSENTDTSTPVTFDLVVCPWPFAKVKKADVIRCRLLYCTLVSGMMSMGLLLYDISIFVCFMWHFTFTCDLQLLSRSLALYSLYLFYVVECLYKKWILGLAEFELWTFVWRKPKWRH